VSFAQQKCFLHPGVGSINKGNCTSAIVRVPAPTPAPKPAPTNAKNVLLIIVDDLRPEIAGFGESFMKTPNIDRLAKQGAAFSRAYCQQAICGPTRNSFLSGRRPQRTKSWNFIDSFREVGPSWVSFPEYFKVNGYTTLGTGKTYHPGIPPNFDEPTSWSQDEVGVRCIAAFKKSDLSQLSPSSLHLSLSTRTAVLHGSQRLPAVPGRRLERKPCMPERRRD
jgi:hypothetical protein